MVENSMLKLIRVLEYLVLIIIPHIVLSNLDAAETGDKGSYQDCISCHESEFQHWKKSDHARSMAVADESTIDADFNNVNAPAKLSS